MNAVLIRRHFRAVELSQLEYFCKAFHKRSGIIAQGFLFFSNEFQDEIFLTC